MKRILLLFSALMLSCIALWAHDVEIDGIFYNLDDTNNTASVTYKGNSSGSYSNEYKGSVSIPNSIKYNSNTYSVTSIGEVAFSSCSGLTSVTIPNSVTSIGGDAFSGCSGLTSVTIPNSVTSIGGDAFSGCSGLTSVTIPNSVTSIDSYAFGGCSGLTSITIPNSVTSIGNYAFEGCSGLTSVVIGNSVTSIGSRAFCNCSSLTSVVWNAKNCTDFSSQYSHPFYNNQSITSFTFGNEVEHIPEELCYEMNKLSEVTIPNSVTSIGSHAFSGCSGLTSVTIPNSVTSIGYYAFEDCSSLASVTIPNSVTSIVDGVFYNCSGLTSVTIGEKVQYIGEQAFCDCSSLTSVTIPNSVTSIREKAFYNCSSLTSVTIPNSVYLFINDSAFRNCSSLTMVNYLGTIEKWGKIEFESSYSNPTYYAKDLYINGELLTDVKISSADGIKKYAFYNCESIKSVEIGNSVTSIGESAFYGCSGLTSIVWNAKNCNISSYSSSPFYDIRSQITSFTIGNEVDYIQYLCYEMENLEEVIIPNSVTSIGSGAFYNCSSLTMVNYLGTVEEWIGIDFESYSSSPTYYAKDLYINGELLTEVKISSADSIKAHAFQNCASISTIELGKNVSYIGASAFAGCRKVKKVFSYPTTVPLAENNSFENYNSYFYIPCEVKEDYDIDAVFGNFKNTKCIEPDVPTDPDTPTEPDTPTNPDVPTDPDTPTDPDVPTEPDVPTVPDEPTEPDTPTDPDVPTDPDTPTVPEEPTEPDVPTNPTIPTDIEFIAIYSDGYETTYALADIRRIDIINTATSAYMNVVNKDGSIQSGYIELLFSTETTTLEEIGEISVYVYPNPVFNTLNIIGVDDTTPLMVYNLNGKCLIQEKGTEVDVTSLLQGTYILNVNNQFIKFIKK